MLINNMVGINLATLSSSQLEMVYEIMFLLDFICNLWILILSLSTLNV